MLKYLSIGISGLQICCSDADARMCDHFSLQINYNILLFPRCPKVRQFLARCGLCSIFIYLLFGFSVIAVQCQNIKLVICFQNEQIDPVYHRIPVFPLTTRRQPGHMICDTAWMVSVAMVTCSLQIARTMSSVAMVADENMYAGFFFF